MRHKKEGDSAVVYLYQTGSQATGYPGYSFGAKIFVDLLPFFFFFQLPTILSPFFCFFLPSDLYPRFMFIKFRMIFLASPEDPT